MTIQAVLPLNKHYLEWKCLEFSDQRTRRWRYPHCSRGRARHFKNAAWWWSFGLGAFNLFNMTLPYAYINGFSQPFDVVFLQVFAAVMLFYGVMTFSISHKWMPFVRLADKAFRALELPGPSNVDLVKSSNQQRTERDPGEFGTFSFRY